MKNQYVVRGGSWYDLPRILRSAYRYWYTSDYRYFDIGFRLLEESTSENSYVRRGGSWDDYPDVARSASRLRNNADGGSDFIGFRLLEEHSDD